MHLIHMVRFHHHLPVQPSCGIALCWGELSRLTHAKTHLTVPGILVLLQVLNLYCFFLDYGTAGFWSLMLRRHSPWLVIGTRGLSATTSAGLACPSRLRWDRAWIGYASGRLSLSLSMGASSFPKRGLHLGFLSSSDSWNACRSVPVKRQSPGNLSNARSRKCSTSSTFGRCRILNALLFALLTTGKARTRSCGIWRLSSRMRLVAFLCGKHKASIG